VVLGAISAFQQEQLAEVLTRHQRRRAEVLTSEGVSLSALTC
jgi:hypothetical protein